MPGKTPRHQPPGPFVTPGEYELVLTVDGETFRQPLTVTLDPRLRVAPEDLSTQLELAGSIGEMMRTSFDAYNYVTATRAALAERLKTLSANPAAKDAADAAAALDKELQAVADGDDPEGLGFVNRDLSRYMTMVESGDARPTDSAHGRVRDACETLRTNLSRWRAANATTIPALNTLLGKYNVAPLPVASVAPEPKCVQ